MKRTKIICTIGPSSDDEETLSKLIKAGMDVARLNFSHGDHEKHSEVFNLIRDLDEEVAIGIDVSGPKIRLGDISNRVILEKGKEIILTTEKILGTDKILPVNYPSLSKEVKKGSLVYINDGFVKLKVTNIANEQLKCQVIDGGEVSSRKGINIPDANLSFRVPTKKDIKDIEKSCQLETDFLFVSFVRSASDIEKIKKIVSNYTNRPIDIISKIEHKDPLNCIDDIIKISDGLMVARGDLAVEVGPAKVPVLQIELIELGLKTAKPVIVATQMLESMTKENFPTRAEASDVAHAVFDGADALMLSSETAVGKHPIRAVQVMKNIVLEAEKSQMMMFPPEVDDITTIGREIGKAAVSLGKRMSATAIIALTQTGYSASMVARNRSGPPIYAMTPDKDTLRQTRLIWGIHPIYHAYEEDFEQLVFNSIEKLHSQKYLKLEDTVILVAGSMVGVPGKTNTIQVLNVAETLAEKH